MLVNLELMEKYLKGIPNIDTKFIDDFINATTQEIDARYIERPKDINGHYIYIKDDLKDSEGKPFTVSSIELTNDGTWIVYGAQVLGHEYANHCRHYIKATIEDTLEDLIDECSKVESDADKYDIIKRYREKLQLKNK